MQAPSPDDACEVIWCLLSFLALPVGKQAALIQAAATEPPQGAASLGDPDLLLDVLEEHHVGWMDAFSTSPSFAKLLDLARTMNSPVSSADFFDGADWLALRALARAALTEAQLDPWPLGHLRLRDFFEVWDGTPRNHWPSAGPAAGGSKH